MKKRALLIEWISHTGERAGGINPKDPKLQCHGWQNIDVNPAIELRLVEDDRDLSSLEEIDGVTIIEGRDEINQAIEDNFPPKIMIEDELFYSEHIKEQIGKGILKFNDMPEDRNERLKLLKNVYHISGIKEIEPLKV